MNNEHETACPQPPANPETAENTPEESMFEVIKKNITVWVEIDKIKVQKIEAIINNEQDEHKIEVYMQQLAGAKRTLRKHESVAEFIRMPIEEDSQDRKDIIINFSKQVKDAVPDDLPLVFHGVNNIGTVREIIETNGLLTPEQRGESNPSFAVQIDVTSKTDIRVSCEFAEPGLDSFMPYGAIFAFMPKPEEIEEVNNTGQSTEVSGGGVGGVNFKDEDRLWAIITTPENIQIVQEWCEQNGLDKDRVLTHDDFIKSMETIKKATSELIE